ncbi:MAG TPA: adenosylmethionine--8-amino-7-oxononanoate transaminase [Fibrobacteraceae bacterium]|nr:adenosylmethionine--8-amino-7-oxononanoate transaminase [Fibrobacteraceae bacterium]
MSDSLWYPYAQMRGLEIQREVVSAQGVRLRLRNGQELIDALSSWWCVIHGYNHPEINAALRAQVEDFAHVMLGGLTHESARRLADKLVEITPPGLNHVFFADSGSVGMEVALKMSVQYWRNRGVSGKLRFATLFRGYHGDTTGVMSVGDPEEGMHHLFRGYLPQQFFVHPPEGVGNGRGEIRHSVEQSLTELRHVFEQHAAEIAAFVCEPLMQGAGGFNFYPPEFLTGARRLCDEYDVLMVLDEVATGFGRTGTLFACEQASIVPDIMTLAKGLTAGYLGLSATLANDRVFDAFLGDGYEQAFMHGPTFMGNALACAVALKGIEVFQRGFYLEKIQKIEGILREELLDISGPTVRETRVLGACGVVEFHSPDGHTGLQDFAADRGIWLRPFLNVAYTMPAYIMEEPDLRKVCAVLRDWVRR